MGYPPPSMQPLPGERPEPPPNIIESAPVWPSVVVLCVVVAAVLAVVAWYAVSR